MTQHAVRRVARDDQCAAAWGVTDFPFEAGDDPVAVNRRSGMRGAIDPERENQYERPADARRHFTRAGHVSDPDLYACVASVYPAFASGSDRSRLPVAAASAFTNAPQIGAIVGSPRPPQNPPLGARNATSAGVSRSCS